MCLQEYLPLGHRKPSNGDPGLQPSEGLDSHFPSWVLQLVLHLCALSGCYHNLCYGFLETGVTFEEIEDGQGAQIQNLKKKKSVLCDPQTTRDLWGEFWGAQVGLAPSQGQLPSKIARPRKSGVEFQEEKKGLLMRDGGREKSLVEPWNRMFRRRR